MNAMRCVAVMLLVVGGMSSVWAAGAVRYEKKPDLFKGTPGPVVSDDGQPVKVMAMPVSVTLPPEAGLSEEAAAELRTAVWDLFADAVDKARALERVPAPDGAQADEVIQKTIAHAAGILGPEEFKGITAFALPEKFVYGHASAMVQEEETLRGLSVVKTRMYHVDAQVRLVESATFTYQPVLASGRAATLKEAIRKAFENALARYRLSEEEAPAPDTGGGGGGFFGG